MECSRKKYENDAGIEKRKRGTCDIFMQRYGSSLVASSKSHKAHFGYKQYRARCFHGLRRISTIDACG